MNFKVRAIVCGIAFFFRHVFRLGVGRGLDVTSGINSPSKFKSVREGQGLEQGVIMRINQVI